MRNVFSSSLRGYFDRNTNILIFLSTMFVVAIGIGAMCVNYVSEDNLAAIGTMFGDYLALARGSDIETKSVFFSMLIFCIKYIFIILLLGFTMFAPIFIVILISIKGFLIGFVTSCILASSDLSYLNIIFINIIMQNMLVLPIIIYFSAESINFSSILMDTMRAKKRGSTYLQRDIFIYAFKCICSLIICVIVCFLVSVFISVFKI